MRKMITDEIVHKAITAYEQVARTVAEYSAMEAALRAVVPMLLEGLAADVRDHTTKMVKLRARAKT